jgi:hypothetical protein
MFMAREDISFLCFTQLGSVIYILYLGSVIYILYSVSNWKYRI